MSGEELAERAAEQIRELISEAERRAEEIVAEAEREAAAIRERGEAEAAERSAAEPEPEPGAEPEPEPQAQPGPALSQARPASDEQGARLIAMKMAVDGASREQIVARLDVEIPAERREAIADEVLARVKS